MSSNYERDRIAEQIRNLKKKLDSLEFDKTRIQRTEQFEIDRIKNEFKTRASILENDQKKIHAEIKMKEKDLERMDLILRKAEQDTLSPAEQAKQNRLHGHLR